VDWKKIATWVLIIFVLYAIINRPSQAGNFVQDGFDTISSAAGQVGEFFDGILGASDSSN
jgi:hypothetical protein